MIVNFVVEIGRLGGTVLEILEFSGSESDWNWRGGFLPMVPSCSSESICKLNSWRSVIGGPCSFEVWSLCSRLLAAR